MKIFDTGKKLEKELETLQKVNSDLKDQVESLQETVKLKNSLIDERLRLKNEIDSLKAEIISMKNKLRKQTEADILLNAFKAVGIIKAESEAKKDDYLHTHDMLTKQLRTYAAHNIPAQSLRAGLGGGLSNFLG